MTAPRRGMHSGSRVPPRGPDDDQRDLGFGAVVSGDSRMRLLNRDGTFNVERRGLSWFTSLSAYHWLLTMTWTRFFLVATGLYAVSNAVFAGLYLACGPNALAFPAGEGMENPFLRAFFFSVQTLATIGYGHIHPVGVPANLVVSVESLCGLLGFALVTGILFARFSRPTANLIFSDWAVVAPFADRSALMFRVVNARKSELIELDVRVVMARFEERGGKRARQYHLISLQRSQVSFFPLGLTLVHVIDERSPLWGNEANDLLDCEAEFLVLVRAIDEGMSQTVHARTSYRADEVRWGARFVSLYDRVDGGAMLSIDVARLHDIEPATLPTTAIPPDRPAKATHTS